MEDSTDKPPSPRGRPRLVSAREERFLRAFQWLKGDSRRTVTNAMYEKRALTQFITDARFAWLCKDSSPQHPHGQLRRGILTELGRIPDDDVREQLALHLCQAQPTTREAVALIRAYRLGQHPHGSAQQLAAIFIDALQAYLQAHPDLSWAEVRQALARLHRVVTIASTDEE